MSTKQKTNQITEKSDRLELVQDLFKDGKCPCGAKLPNSGVDINSYVAFFTDTSNRRRLAGWIDHNHEQIITAITDRNRDRLLLPRIDARLSELVKQLKRLETKYQMGHQRVSARDLVTFGIKYPIANRVYDYQYRSPRHSPVRGLDGESGLDHEFIEISHSYEPRLYDVRFHLEREIETWIWQYNRIDRRNYFKEFRYDLLRLLPKGFPVRDHFHCLLSQLNK